MSRSSPWESRRRDLYFALRTRPLTEEEMTEVAEYGDSLNVQSGVPFTPADKLKELNDAYVTQFRLRTIALAASRKGSASGQP